MSLSKLEQRVLDFLQEDPQAEYKVDQIAQRLNYKGTKNYKKLIKALAFLERVGEIQLTPAGKFRPVSQAGSIKGVYRANDKGFGFLSVGEDQPDLFVPRGKNAGAMDGDTVLAKVIKAIDPTTGKGSEAEIVEIIDRKASQLVGEFFAYNQDERAEYQYLGYIKPQGEFSDTVKVLVRPDGIHPADHTICIVKITEYPNKNHPDEMIGIVSKEIGHRDAPGIDILAILYQFGIPHEFPENVVEAAEAVEQTIDPQDLQGREDLRDQLIITIDGADAKDLDDAISLQKVSDNEYQLGVHIADVSHYVTEGSPIDREAYERGTSVYLTDRVVPMLPQRLSNGICSLHPHEDRLTLTCQMTINKQGKVTNYRLFKSVIQSAYRMTYQDVNAILDGDLALRKEYEEIVEMLDEMAELHQILLQMRKQRGALDFDAPEAKIVVDEEGHPQDIILRQRYTGERLIESFMLIANETVAAHVLQKNYPFLYRIHEQPDEAKMDRFAEFITSFGIILRGDTAKIEPKQLQAALKQVKGTEFEQVVSTMMLRSMQQAKYSEEPAGHFGLASEDYTHFTSPIRRYPDLIVHRLLSKYLQKAPTHKEVLALEGNLPGIADHSSKMERRAVDAEREMDALKKAEYMVDKVGETFWGTISSITSFGIFVSLPNTVEGLINLKALTDDYYQFNPHHLLLIGERTGKVYRIGQQVKIEVLGVNVEEREIDFALIEAEPVKVDERLLQVAPKKEKSKGRKKRSTKRGQRRKDFSSRTHQPKKRGGQKQSANRQFKIKRNKRK